MDRLHDYTRLQKQIVKAKALQHEDLMGKTKSPNWVKKLLQGENTEQSQHGDGAWTKAHICLYADEALNPSALHIYMKLRFMSGSRCQRWLSMSISRLAVKFGISRRWLHHTLATLQKRGLIWVAPQETGSYATIYFRPLKDLYGEDADVVCDFDPSSKSFVKRKSSNKIREGCEGSFTGGVKDRSQGGASEKPDGACKTADSLIIDNKIGCEAGNKPVSAGGVKDRSQGCEGSFTGGVKDRSQGGVKDRSHSTEMMYRDDSKKAEMKDDFSENRKAVVSKATIHAEKRDEGVEGGGAKSASDTFVKSQSTGEIIDEETMEKAAPVERPVSAVESFLDLAAPAHPALKKTNRRASGGLYGGPPPVRPAKPVSSRAPVGWQETFEYLKAEIQKRWPDAHLPVTLLAKDKKLLQRSVCDCYEPDTVREMIRVFVWDWEPLAKTVWPHALNQKIPDIVRFARYAPTLASAAGVGYTAGAQHRRSKYYDRYCLKLAESTSKPAPNHGLRVFKGGSGG